MEINGKHYRTIWEKEGDPAVIQIIDQRKLPHKFEIASLKTANDAAEAISGMFVRGAPLIGVTAAYGMYLAALNASDMDDLRKASDKLISARPTAINLAWAVKEQLKKASEANDWTEVKNILLANAREIAEDDVHYCRSIGENGIWLIEQIAKEKDGQPVNILTHCNAGWLATVDYGTATAPIYVAHDMGIELHVWVDETRPRNQGAKLTAWELTGHGVPNTLIADNTGGHLMQHEMVDMVLVGSDRTTYTGDVANKIGTYLKALAARENDIPFYVALPSTTIDWKTSDGVKDIPIEQRDDDEVKFMDGLDGDEVRNVLITGKNVKAANYAFDVTPNHLVTALITERGICKADKGSILELFPEKISLIGK